MLHSYTEKENTKSKSISVLVMGYNHEKFVESAIDSILSQKGDFDLELIYCDDASSDHTPEIVRRIECGDPRLKPVLRSNNVGLLKNFLDGISRCSGEYIAYCDGDDFWLDRNKLNRQILHLEEHRDCSFAFHDILIADAQGNLGEPWSAERASRNWIDGFKTPEQVLSPELIVFHATSVLFRRSAVDLEFLKSINSNIQGLDYALAIMLSASGYGYYECDASAAYRKHTNSISARRSLNPSALVSIIREVESLERIVNTYYKGIFRQYLKSNRRGHVTQTVHALIWYARREKSFRGIMLCLKESVIALHGGAFSIRDVLYIVRSVILCR